MVAFLADLANAERLAPRLSTFAKLTVSLPGLIFLAVLVLYAGARLAQIMDKILLGLRRLAFGESTDWIDLAFLYLGTKTHP